MNKLLLPLLVFMFVACTKEKGSGSIAGTWKMIRVTDIQTGNTNFKPLTLQGDVVISFAPQNDTAGTFSGNTPSNEIMQNEFTFGPDGTLNITSLSMTKVAETSWGLEFVDHILTATRYSLEAANRLSIRTTYRILVFQKI